MLKGEAFALNSVEGCTTGLALRHYACMLHSYSM